VAGTWAITESLTDNCPDPDVDEWTATVTQNGTSVTVSGGGVSRSGTLNGNVLTWSGSYLEDGGTTTVSSLTLTFSGDTVTGNATWSWTDGSSSCSGTSAITGIRMSRSGTAPNAPSGLSAVTTSSGSIDLMWQDNADNEDAYIVERSEVSSTTNFSVVITLPADSQSFSDSGLTPATTYYYRVAASNSDGQSGYSNVRSATTDTAPPTPPVAPSNLNGSATSSTSVDLFWTDQSDNESSFDIYQAISPSGSFALAKTVSANETSASIDGLTPATTYAFKVVAVNSAGPSLDSNIHEITTPAEPIEVPNPPLALTVSNATHNSLTLNWTDNSNNETGFQIYRSSSQNGTYGEIAITSASSYTNTGLSASTSYWYKVSAYNDAGESVQIGPESGTTLSPQVDIPSAPTNAVISNITSNSATLSWTDTSNNESGFEVGYCDGLASTGILRCSPGPIPRTGFKVIAQVGAGVTSFTFTGLSPDTKYSRFVRACNTAGCSANIGSSFTTEAQTASPSIVRIVNDLPSNDPWGDYNGLIRIRIGPSMESLYNRNTEQLTPLDSVPYDPANGSAIPLELLVPGQSLDLDASGFTGEYWIYIEAGWWDLVLDFITFEPLYWQKTPTNVYGCDGSEGYQKWSFIRVIPPFGDPEVIQVSDFLPMYGTWVGHPNCP
jgi:fibronectin type 3 domain-containing protein